jgi:hypothetical protein
MMCGRPVLVDLSKDCRLVIDCLRFPTEEASWQARNFPGKGQFRSRHHTHCQSKIIRGGEAACAGAEITRYEFISDLRGP